MLNDVPSGWSWRPFADFATESRIDGGNGATAQKLTVKLYGKGVVPKEEKTVGSVNTRYFRRKAGQLIYSKLDFLNGAFALIPPELDGRESTADLPAFDLTPDVEPKWILEYVKRPAFYERTAVGAIGSRKARRVSPKQFGKIRILTPPLPEQKKIAAILASVDEAIRATEAVIVQTRRVKDGLLQDLLTRGIGHTRFKQTEIGEIPESWEVRKLPELCTRVGVGIASSATHAYREEGIPLVRNQNIKPGYLDLSDLLYVSPEYDEQNRTKRIRRGDVLTIRTGYPGISAVVPPELDNTQSFTTLVSRPKPKLLDSHFLAAWINSEGGKQFVLGAKAGGAQQNLNAGTLKSLPVPLPPLAEQRAMMEQLDAWTDGERRSESELVSLMAVKAGLLQDLLSGAVRVSA